MHRSRGWRLWSGLAGVLLWTLAGASAWGHVDTLAQVLKNDPLVRTFEAEALPRIGGGEIGQDEQATGGKHVAVSAPGDGFAVDLGELQPGIYALYICGRVLDEDALIKAVNNDSLLNTDVQTRPLYFELSVNSGNDGEVQTHRMRVPFSPDRLWEYMGKIYFHAPAARAYRAQLVVGRDTAVRQIQIDRLELRNPLGALQFARVKEQQVLVERNAVKALRIASAKEGKLPEPMRPQPLSAAERAARDEVMWNQSVMPLNAQPAQIYGDFKGHEAQQQAYAKASETLGKPLGKWVLTSNAYDEPWVLQNKELGLTYTLADYVANKPLPAPWPFPEDKGAHFFDGAKLGLPVSFNFGVVGGLIQQRYHSVLAALGATPQGKTSFADLPGRYVLLGDLEAAADAAFLLAAYAYRYPAYDWNLHCLVNVYQVPRTFAPSHNNGRGCSYEGWSTGEVQGVVEAYDKLFPYIEGNADLARRVGRFVPWVKTPDDVLKLIDTFLVQRAAQDAVQHILYAPILPTAAVVLGPGKVSEHYLDIYFTTGIYQRDTLCGFSDAAVNGYSRDGLNYIGSTYYTVGESIEEMAEIARLMERYLAVGGARRFAFGDPKQTPRVAACPDSLLRLHIAGGYDTGIGDVGEPTMPYRPYMRLDPARNAEFFQLAWHWTKDPRIAWILAHKVGQQSLSDREWQQVQQRAAEQRDPLLHTQSQVLEGYGLATLEENTDADNFQLKLASMLRFGVGSGHAHPDTLDLELYAFGLRMSSDMGGRLSSRYGRPTCMSNKVHNLVEVDEREFNGGPQNSTALGWLTAFKPAPGVQFVAGQAHAETHPHVDLYARSVAQIVSDAGDGQTTPARGYLFDVFRVRGGKVHTWNFHGAVSQDFISNAGLSPASSELAKRYLARHHDGTEQEGVAPEVLHARWTLRRKDEQVGELKLRNAELNMLGKERYDENSPLKHTAVSLFGAQGQQVLVGNWYADDMPSRHFSFPLLHVRREGDGQTPLQSVYPALIEPQLGESIIASAEQLPLPGDSATRPVALQVKTTLGQTDWLFASLDGAAAVKVNDQFTGSGRLAAASFDSQGLRLAHLVGGSTLQAGAVQLTAQTPEYQSVIRSYNPQNASANVEPALPATLAGAIVTTGGTLAPSTRKLTTVEGNKVGFDRSSMTYRGGVEFIDPDGKYFVLDLAPYLYNYHPDYYEGMVAVNEAGQTLGRVRVQLGERFWYTGWPDARQHLGQIAAADLADTNGDGKVTFDMLVSPLAGRTRQFAEDGTTLLELKPGDQMLQLEVTRRRDDGFMFYTQQHPRPYLDALKTPHPGWPYHQQIVRNEAGTREWVVNMPGDLYQLTIADRKISAGDLPDTDGDGRRMVFLHDLGPGSTLTAPTSVALRRVRPGLFELRADVACSVTLPGGKAALSTDQGATFTDLPATAQGGAITVNLSLEQVARESVWLRVQ